MTTRTPSPRAALDYPHLDDAAWILWSGNEYVWPDGRRQTWFLSRHERHVIQEWALFTRWHKDAVTFADERAALEFLAHHETLRGHPYSLKCTTVAEMKRARGYEVQA